MEGEYFYGAVLGEAGASTTWSSAETGEDEQGPIFKLVTKQILLGPTAKVDEYNVVQVETTSSDGPVKIPIAVLKVGETRTALIYLDFPESPVTFKLIEGSGPIYIHGNIISGYVEQVDDEMEDECMEMIEEEQDNEVKGENKKRKMGENGSKASATSNGSANNQKPNKKAKTGEK